MYATNVLSRSRVKALSPEIVDHEVMSWTRPNPAVLDAPPIMMTVADLDLLNGLGLIYPTWKIQEFLYLEHT
jgi:hypothetical protein